MSWGCFDLEIASNEKIILKVSSSCFMLSHNGNQA